MTSNIKIASASTSTFWPNYGNCTQTDETMTKALTSTKEHLIYKTKDTATKLKSWA